MSYASLGASSPYGTSQQPYGSTMPTSGGGYGAPMQSQGGAYATQYGTTPPYKSTASPNASYKGMSPNASYNGSSTPPKGYLSPQAVKTGQAFMSGGAAKTSGMAPMKPLPASLLAGGASKEDLYVQLMGRINLLLLQSMNSGLSNEKTAACAEIQTYIQQIGGLQVIDGSLAAEKLLQLKPPIDNNRRLQMKTEWEHLKQQYHKNPSKKWGTGCCC